MKIANDFLHYVVENLVDNMDAVSIDSKEDEMGTLFTLQVAPDDMGKIIGKNGTTIQSLRTLLKMIGFKHNVRVTLRVEEPQA